MTKNLVFEVVKKAVLEVLPDLDPELVTLEKQLRDLGANSIDRMEVVTISMEALRLKLPLMSFAKVGNLDDLVGVFIDNLSLTPSK